MNDHELFAWDQVAQLLRSARAEAGWGGSLPVFAEAVGAGKSQRVLSDLENAKRSNYERQTLANVEVWYGLVPGQIRELVTVAKRVAYLDEAFRAARERGDETVLDGIGHDAEVAHNEMNRLVVLRRASPETGSVRGIRHDDSTAEGAVGERATAVQVGAVRDFITTMRDALDKLEEAFEEGD